MFVKFANTDVHIYKLKKGTPVEYNDDFYHIEFVYRTVDRQVKLILQGVYEPLDISPQFVTWLET